MAGSAVVGALRVLLSLDTANYETAMANASRQATTWGRDLGKMGQQASRVGSALTQTLTLPIVGVATAALATGAEFDKVMNGIQGVLRPTSDQMETIRQTAMQMGADTVFSASQAGEAILELGKAGFDTDKAIGSVGHVLELAAASGMTMADSAAMAARALNAFGLESGDLQRVNDTLAAAVNTTSLEIEDLRVAFGYVGPVANGFNLSIEEVSAALGIMRNNGIAAETTGRALREGFTRLVNPTKAVYEVMDELGIKTFETADGGMMNLSQIIGLLEEKGITTGQAFKMFGDAAGPGMAALVQQGRGALDAFTLQLQNSDGAAKAMADAMMQGLPGALEKAKGSMETAAIAAKSALEPALISILNAVGKLGDFVTTTIVPAFESLPAPVRAAGLALAGIAAAIGPVVWVSGELITAVGTVVAFFAKGALGAKILAGAFAALTSPIGLVVAAIVGLGLAWMKWGDDVTRVVTTTYAAVKEWLWDKLEPVLAPIGGLLQSLGEMFGAFRDLVIAVGQKIGEMFIDRLTEEWGTLTGFFDRTIGTIKGWLDRIPDSLLPLLGPIGLVIAAFRHWSEITTIAQAVYTGVKTWLIDRFVGIVDGIKAKIDAVTGFFRDMHEAVVGNSYVPDMVMGIALEFAKLQTQMVNPAVAACRAVTQAFADTHPLVAAEIDKIVSAAQGGMDGILRYASDFAMNFTAAVLDTIVPGLGQLVQVAWPILEKGLVELGKRIGSFFGWVWSGIESIGRALGNVLGGTPNEDHNDPHENQTDYSGNDPGFSRGGWGNFGSGTRAVLHGTEAVFPLPRGFDLASALEALVDVKGFVGKEKITPYGQGAGEMAQIVIQFDRAAVAEQLVPVWEGAKARLRVG